jgi:hypothetical protein
VADQDTEQRDRDKAHTTDHDEYGQGAHGAADWCPSRRRSPPDAVTITST